MLCKDIEIASASELQHITIANEPSHGNLQFLLTWFVLLWHEEYYQGASK